MTYYLLKIPMFNQYKFAWAEFANNPNISNEFPKCPKCGSATGMLFWLPPYDIVLKQPRRVGDFVNGVIGTDLIVSDNFFRKYQESNLTGITSFIEVNVVKMGTKTNSSYEVPKLYGATFRISHARVDYKKMGVKWFEKPKKNFCDLCGPGGGGDGGIYESYNRIVLIPETLGEEDFFIPINFGANILISEKAKEFIESNGFTNFHLTADFEAKHNIFRHIK